MLNEKHSINDFKVVVNVERQYSIWPLNKENAFGWTDVGFQSEKEECLEYIAEVWKDMRPYSLIEYLRE